MLELARESVPAVDAHGMREVDRIMTDVLGIDLSRMMELAGRHAARLTADVLLADSGGRRVTALAGRGGNGGGVLVAARRLAGWGFPVAVCLSRPRHELAPVPARQLDILERMGVPCIEDGEPGRGDAVLDGLIGYSLNGAPLGRARELVTWANEGDAPVLSLDVPSGLDATSGEIPGCVVHATLTLTLALPKTGLLSTRRPDVVGDLYLGDIGVPPAVYAHVGIDAGPIFTESDLVRLL